jgi:hypothetical protein
MENRIGGGDHGHDGHDGIDALIRWALHDSIAEAEPSPILWDQIQRRIQQEQEITEPPPRRRQRYFARRSWLGWLIGAGANYPVPGDPRAAWQRRLHGFDMQASLSIVRIVEGKMPALRVVA